jgi:predicted porin
MRVCAGLKHDLLQRCNVIDVFLTVVICQTTSVWFNTCNFPKTEVGSEKFRAPVQTLENLEMKKTLVAIAALAATGAFAQSSVTISGNFDAGYSDTKSQTAGATKTEIAANGSSTSHVKFAGTEDLGGGLKAGFVGVQLISPVSGQTGNAADGSSVAKGGFSSSNWFNDEIWVGLESAKMGALKLGAPNAGLYETVSGKSSPFGTALGGGYSSSGITRLGKADSTPLFGLNQYVGGGSANGRVVRAEKSVRYDTPTFAGFNANYVFAPKADNNTTAGATTNANGFSNLTLNYTNGPLVAAYSTATIEAGKYQAAGANGTSALDANAKVKHNAFAANYTMGAATVYAGMTTSKTEGEGSAFDVKSSNVAIKYAVTPMIDVLANTVKVTDKAASSPKDQSLNAVSAIYKFSKRTSAYATYQKGDTDKSSATAGEYKQTIVGLRHQF